MIGAGGGLGSSRVASMRNAGHPCVPQDILDAGGCFGCFTRRKHHHIVVHLVASNAFLFRQRYGSGRNIQQRLFASRPVASRPVFFLFPLVRSKKGHPIARPIRAFQTPVLGAARRNRSLGERKSLIARHIVYPRQLANRAQGARQTRKQKIRNPASTALSGLPCPHPSPSGSLPFPTTHPGPPVNDREITPRRCASQGIPAKVRGCITNSNRTRSHKSKRESCRPCHSRKDSHMSQVPHSASV